MERSRIDWFRWLVAAIGAQFIYGLIWLFGRTYRRDEIAWLMGPLGGPVIGDASYEEVAAREGLSIERNAQRCGLIPDVRQLDGTGFHSAHVHPAIRDFYEHTAEYAMDVWSRTYFPSNIALALLVTTISRQVNQLNFRCPRSRPHLASRARSSRCAGATVPSGTPDGFARWRRAPAARCTPGST